MIEMVNVETTSGDLDKQGKVARYVTWSGAMSPSQLRKATNRGYETGIGLFTFLAFGIVAAVFGWLEHNLIRMMIEDRQGHTTCNPFALDPVHRCVTVPGDIDMVTLTLSIVTGLVGVATAVLAAAGLVVFIMGLCSHLVRLPEGTMDVETDSPRWLVAREFLEKEMLEHDTHRTSLLTKVSGWIRLMQNISGDDGARLLPPSTIPHGDASIWSVFSDALHGANGLEELGRLIDPSVSRFVIETEASLKFLGTCAPGLRCLQQTTRIQRELAEIAACELAPIVDPLRREVIRRREKAASEKKRRKYVSQSRQEIAKMWKNH